MGRLRPDVNSATFSPDGSQLISGFDDGTVGMYDVASGQRLTLDVRAAAGSETAFRFQREGDAATFAWIDQGFGFAVTAPATREDLLPIAEAVYRGVGAVSSSK